MSDRTYTTNIDLKTGAVHVALTDAEMVAWIEKNVDGPLFVQILDLIEQYGAQQVLIVVGFASAFDLWRRDNPERWEEAIAKHKRMTDD